MTPDYANDPLLRALARLPGAVPDEARASRVRERCHATLERARLRSTRPARPKMTPIVSIDPGNDPRGHFSMRAIEAALVGGLCLLYLSTVLLEAGRLLPR